ncbi:MAG: hypothetical protein FWB85_02235 [Chitinispirillia bacterium]|nr:hypothetical protein [Chitinispirillia bacterium]MCL2241224.1 hypothetical protein [Chitinispirillia bacterium]
MKKIVIICFTLAISLSCLPPAASKTVIDGQPAPQSAALKAAIEGPQPQKADSIAEMPPFKTPSAGDIVEFMKKHVDLDFSHLSFVEDPFLGEEMFFPVLENRKKYTLQQREELINTYTNLFHTTFTRSQYSDSPDANYMECMRMFIFITMALLSYDGEWRYKQYLRIAEVFADYSKYPEYDHKNYVRIRLIKLLIQIDEAEQLSGYFSPKENVLQTVNELSDYVRNHELHPDFRKDLLILFGQGKEVENSTMFVDVEKTKIIIKIKTRSTPEQYRGGVYFIDIGNTLSSRTKTSYPQTQPIKHYVDNDMFVIEIDKQRVTDQIMKFNTVAVTLNNGNFEIYSYKSDKHILPIEEPKEPHK